MDGKIHAPEDARVRNLQGSDDRPPGLSGARAADGPGLLASFAEAPPAAADVALERRGILPRSAIRRWSALVLLLAGCAGSQRTATVTLDDFSDGVIDTSRFEVYGLVAESDGMLAMWHPAGSIEPASIRLWPKAALEGEFDVQVSYRIEGFVPPRTPHRSLNVAMGLISESGDHVAVIECYVAPPLDCNPERFSYKALVDQSLNCAPDTRWAAADSTGGRFRMRRRRSTVDLSYWREGDWVVLKTAPFQPERLRLALFSGSGGHLAAPEHPRRVLFDDLRIETFAR